MAAAPAFLAWVMVGFTASPGVFDDDSSPSFWKHQSLPAFDALFSQL